MPQKTLLAIGAHYDDCIFGVGGILLQAVAKGYRVVVLTLVGDPDFFGDDPKASVKTIDQLVRIGADHGVEMRFLDFVSQRFDLSTPAKLAVGAVVNETKPDVAFMMWPHDTHTDHEVTSALSKVALLHGGRLMKDPTCPAPYRHLYTYGNGPTHTIGFTPDTLVDVTSQYEATMDWLGRSFAAREHKTYVKTAQPVEGSLNHYKETQLRYFGWLGDVRYAEAVLRFRPVPRDILP